MGNLEKYGVLALIFVIVLILTVAIWNGPQAAEPPSAAKDVVIAAGGPVSAEASEAEIRRKLRQQYETGNAAPTAPPTTPAPGPAHAAGGVEPGPSFRTYTVAKNDTLEKIAKRELGAASRWRDIVKANEGLDPKRLRVGQAILLPH